MTAAVEHALYRGDALDLGAKLGDRRFRLTYLDPPYAVGMKHRARGEKGDRAAGEVAYVDAGARSALLEMLGPRLRVLRELMAVDGSLWLHLDQRAAHEAKVLCDGIFGARAFMGEIIWVPGNGARGGFPATHQTILVYARADASRALFRGDDPAMREPYAATSQKMHFQRVDEQGRRYRERTIANKTYRYYADVGRRRGSVWTDLPAMSANTPLRREATGYPTQKPLGLLDRIVRASTEPGDWVLDPMCGSGTTVEAALRAGRSAVGNDESAMAFEIATARIAACVASISTGRADAGESERPESC